MGKASKRKDGLRRAGHAIKKILMERDGLVAARSHRALGEEMAKVTGQAPPISKADAQEKLLIGHQILMVMRGQKGTKTFPLPARSQKPEKRNFYLSESWYNLRYRALVLHGAKCQCCGATAKSSGRPLHVDHIKPRSKYPELQLDINNLQVLCEACNKGKRAWDETDWR